MELDATLQLEPSQMQEVQHNLQKVVLEQKKEGEMKVAVQRPCQEKKADHHPVD